MASKPSSPKSCRRSISRPYEENHFYCDELGAPYRDPARLKKLGSCLKGSYLLSSSGPCDDLHSGVEQPCLFTEPANKRTYRRWEQDLDLAESASRVGALDGGVTICRLALCRLSPVGR
jgi:hypothetical protein